VVGPDNALPAPVGIVRDPTDGAPDAQFGEDSVVNDQELGPYRIASKLGAGGMGDVWLATEISLGRKIALKLLPPDLTRDPARVQRFEQEARAASALTHPNVCTILALGRSAEGQHYIAMEYVEGETLRQRLTAKHMGPSRRSTSRSRLLAPSVPHTQRASSIGTSKPENVMIRRDGFVESSTSGWRSWRRQGSTTPPTQPARS
jgi:serine/threonine protein kinase